MLESLFSRNKNKTYEQKQIDRQVRDTGIGSFFTGFFSSASLGYIIKNPEVLANDGWGYLGGLFGAWFLLTYAFYDSLKEKYFT